MKYVKPEVALVAAALTTIQSDPLIKDMGNGDAHGNPDLNTINAYQADE
jgi:hypothetical protein